MLATYIEKEGVQVKLVTIQYANDVFTHNNVATRSRTQQKKYFLNSYVIKGGGGKRASH